MFDGLLWSKATEVVTINSTLLNTINYIKHIHQGLVTQSDSRTLGGPNETSEEKYITLECCHFHLTLPCVLGS